MWSSSSELRVDDVLSVKAPEQLLINKVRVNDWWALQVDEACYLSVSSDPTDPTDPTEPLYCSVIYRTQLWNRPWCRCCPLQGVTCHRDPPNKQLEFKRRQGSFSVSDSASDVTDETFNTFTLHSVSRRDAESAILKLHSEVSHTQWLADSVTQWLADSVTRWLGGRGCNELFVTAGGAADSLIMSLSECWCLISSLMIFCLRL